MERRSARQSRKTTAAIRPIWATDNPFPLSRAEVGAVLELRPMRAPTIPLTPPRSGTSQLTRRLTSSGPNSTSPDRQIQMIVTATVQPAARASHSRSASPLRV